jgi:hypothetical protein
MRSRMWMGGQNTALGDNPGVIGRTLARTMQPVAGKLLPSSADLLVHNAQEMAHLASFLPQLFEKFGAAYRERQP